MTRKSDRWRDLSKFFSCSIERLELSPQLQAGTSLSPAAPKHLQCLSHYLPPQVVLTFGCRPPPFFFAAIFSPTSCINVGTRRNVLFHTCTPPCIYPQSLCSYSSYSKLLVPEQCENAGGEYPAPYRTPVLYSAT